MRKLYSPGSIMAWLALACITSCGRTGQAHIAKGDPNTYNLDSAAAHSSVADLVENLTAIQLETTDSSVIASPYSIKRIIYKNDRYFVLDQKFFSVKVFDSKGKYLYDIGSLGLGHGQWVHLEDLETSYEGDELILLANRPQKIMRFTFEGKLIKEQNLNFFASQVAFPTKDTRVFYVNQNKSDEAEDKNLLFTDTNNVVRERIFDMPPDLNAVVNLSGGLHSTGQTGQGIYFNPAFSDTFYTITGNIATPAYRIQYGVRQIPSNLRRDDILSNMRKYSFPCATFVKYNDYIGFNYQKGPRASALINTHTGKIATSDIAADSMNMLFTNYLFENNQKLTILLDIDQLADFITRNASAIQQRYPGLLSNIRIDKKRRQNPALLTFTLKNGQPPSPQTSNTSSQPSNPTPQQAQDPASTTARLSKKLIDVGDQKVHSDVKASFTIYNTGSSDLYIQSVEPDCHCTVASFSQKAILPKDSSIITLKYDAARPGPFQSSAFVTTNAGQASMVLIFRGNIIQ